MDQVQDIKDRLDIVEIISGYLTVKRAGVNFKARCPFHTEKSPSFMINTERQIYKCFGCGESGDVYTFIEKMEGLDFFNALKLLADKAGVKLESESVKFGSNEFKADKKTKLFEINEWTKRVYHKILTDHPKAEKAREYLKKRGMSQKTIEEFEIGYAPNSWDFIIKFLKSKSYTELEMAEAGVVTTGDRGKYYDRFRGRIIFPINNIMGSTIAFTSRILDDNDPKAGAKYINSSESTIYKKGSTIYGLDKAKMAIKEEGVAVMVEGNMDVIACHQAEFKNVVATSGTALTSDQIKILSRYADTIAFSFDSDNAGIIAMKRAIKIAVQNEINSKIVALPKPFKDPDEAIKKDPNIWKEAIKQSKPSLEYWIELLLASFETLDVSAKKTIAKEILPVIKITASSIERDHYLHYLAKKLDVSESSLIDAIEKVKTDPSDQREKPSQLSKKEPTLTSELKIMGLIWANEKLLKNINNEFSEFELEDPKLSSFVEMIKSKEIDKGKLKPEEEMVLDQLAVTALANIGSDDEEVIQKEFLFLLGKIRSDRNEDLRRSFAKKIEEAEAAGDKDALKKLLLEFSTLIK